MASNSKDPILHQIGAYRLPTDADRTQEDRLLQLQLPPVESSMTNVLVAFVMYVHIFLVAHKPFLFASI